MGSFFIPMQVSFIWCYAILMQDLGKVEQILDTLSSKVNANSS